MADFLKFITPFITFMLGVILAPYVESLKEKRSIKLKVNNIFTELDDACDYLTAAIQTTNKSIQKRAYLALEAIYLNIAMPFDLQLTTTNFEAVYSSLNKDCRKGFKVLLQLRDKINTSMDQVIRNHEENNHKCLFIEKNMLNTMLMAYYLMNALKNSKEHFKFPTTSESEIIEIAAKSLKVTLIH